MEENNDHAIAFELRSERLAEEIADLKRQLAEALKDTDRINWLTGQKYLCYGINTGDWIMQIETGGYAERGITLRHEIDEALRRERDKLA